MRIRWLLAALAISSTFGFAQCAHASQWDASWDTGWDTGYWFGHRLAKDDDCLDYGTYGVQTIYSNGFAFIPKTCGGFIVDSFGRKIDIGPWRPNDYTYGSAPLYPPRTLRYPAAQVCPSSWY